MTPRISVLLPCRDVAATLGEALDSLVRQTFDDFEVIAVDDGSSDGTAAVLERWRRGDGRIRVVRTPALGIVAALRRAAAEARGELLARMDADDVARQDRFAEQVAWLDRHPDAVGCGALVRYFPREGLRDGARRYERWINAQVAPHEIARDLFVECPIPHPTLVLRRRAHDAAGGYRDAAWPEDYDLVLRLAAAGATLGKVPEVLLAWRDGPSRLSRAAAAYSEDAFRRCKARYLGPLRLRGRCVVVWGAGPVGKAFARALAHEGHEIRAFVDLDPRKIGQVIHGAPVIAPDAVHEHRGGYVIAAVGQEGARDDIRRALVDLGWREVDEFCAVA